MKQQYLAASLVLAFAISTISATAIASEEDEIKGRTVKVSYADLNLEKEQGARTLYRRLQHASKKACGVESSKNSGSVRAVSDAYRCYRQTLTAQVNKIDIEILTGIHEG